jgi:hypothetical protein
MPAAVWPLSSLMRTRTGSLLAQGRGINLGPIGFVRDSGQLTIAQRFIAGKRGTCDEVREADG